MQSSFVSGGGGYYGGNGGGPNGLQQEFGNGQGNGQGNGHNGQAGQGNGSPVQPEYSLAGVLHYLQSEWRRYERDRNEWEIERAEMRVSRSASFWSKKDD